jgi:hypothetical protein
MKIGMLWFDNDKQTDLVTKIEDAADYYQHKYGLRPNLCFVHPSMAPEDIPDETDASLASEDNQATVLQAGNVVVKTSKSVLPNHIWIGVNGINGRSKS